MTYRVQRTLRGVNFSMTRRHEGPPSVSLDTDHASERLRRRTAGTFEVRIALPKRLLKAGRYPLDFGVGRPNAGHIDRRPNALAFSIEERSETVSHLSYARRRPGGLMMPIDWHRKQIQR